MIVTRLPTTLLLGADVYTLTAIAETGDPYVTAGLPMTVSVPNLGSQTFNIAANNGYVFQRAVDENNNVLTLVNKT